MIETVEQHRVKIGNIIASEIDNVKNRDEMLKVLKKLMTLYWNILMIKMHMQIDHIF